MLVHLGLDPSLHTLGLKLPPTGCMCHGHICPLKPLHCVLCMQSLRDKSNELEIKLDKEINMLKATTEQVKNETVKYCLGLLLAFTTAGLGAARLVSR